MHRSETANSGAATPILAAAPNFRDMGGLRAADGRRTRAAVLYRSGALDELEEGDLAVLETLGIALCFDLRSQGERIKHPSRWPASNAPRILAMEVSTDIRALDRAAMQYLIENPDRHGAGHLMRAIYRNMPDSCAPVLKAVIAELSALRAPGAAVIHCTAGKDRTGFVAALLLKALGMADADVYADYLESNSRYDAGRNDAKIAALLESMFGVVLGADALTAITAAREEYLDAAFDAIRGAWGSVDAYLHICGGLRAASRERLREVLLD
jgi:protein-tyrosine phosphatase